MLDVAERLANRVQLTTDGHAPIYMRWRARLVSTWISRNS